MRVILASSRGTIMELGITPLVTSGMVMQLPVGSKIIQVDNNLREDRALIMYGSVGQLGVGNAILIIVHSALRYHSIRSNDHQSLDEDREFEGVCYCLVPSLSSLVLDKVQALREAFCLQNLPNVLNLISTLFIFGIVNYLQGLRVLLNVKSRNARGRQGSYPIKLFYTSNMPIILRSALVSNLYFISRIQIVEVPLHAHQTCPCNDIYISTSFSAPRLLYRRFSGSFIVNLLGKWKESEYAGGQFTPVALVLHTTSLHHQANPFHALFYLIFMLSACALFSKTWIEVSGSSARDVARQLREQQMIMPGHRDVERTLNCYIPTAAAFGGVCIGGLTVLADLMGAIGSGTGILLAVTIIYQYFETFEKEKTGDLRFF
ncbi:hypothetical protein Scep_011744 [Stephania cephalantha]|uniref:Uncharacterized protein n=1 Tax=Stephania cephalantha TaxID=152367 RepID=A0AAP0JDQ1_9MAGN